MLFVMVTAAALVPGVARAGHVACADVIREVNHEMRLTGGGLPDISHIAKEIGSTPAWVERCLQVYGRRAKRPDRQAPENREAQVERYESEEPEESASEDLEEQGGDRLPKLSDKPPIIRPTPKRLDY